MTYNDTSGIEALIASGDYDSAMKTLNAELEKSTDATMLALRGDLNWKLGHRAQAIITRRTDFGHSPRSHGLLQPRPIQSLNLFFSSICIFHLHFF